MKKIFLILLTTSLIQTTFSQSISASGTIKNENSDPVPAALVSEFKSAPATATYTDSLGFFKFSVKKYSKLIISCKGYNDTLINLSDKKDVLIILTKAKSVKHSDDVSNNTENPLINKNLVEDAVSTQTGVNNNYVYGGGVRNYTGSLMPVFTQKEDTKGSRYLFSEWAHGSVVNADNSTFNNPAYLYNYDKIGGVLLLTQDKESVIEADKAQIKFFTVYIDKDNPLIFESVPAVDNAHFVQVISSGNKFKIYKLTKTKFVKSNYHTDGIATTGNPYDEYIDENTYYVSDVATAKLQKISLKKKAIKEVFGQKADQFFQTYTKDISDESVLKEICDYMNNN